MRLWPSKRKDLTQKSAVVKPYVDESYYRHECRAFGLEGDLSDLTAHYLEVGWKLGLDPSAAFSTRRYLHDYPDIAEAGLNPLLHYVEYGQFEGRRPRPAAGEVIEAGSGTSFALNEDVLFGAPLSGQDVTRPRVRPSKVWVDEHGRIVEVPLAEPVASDEYASRDFPADAAKLVDDEFYRGMYPDLQLKEGDSSAHFMTRGWQEGRDPNYWFDTLFYLGSNPDVAASGANPLVHYLANGRFEGRLPRLANLRDRNFILRQESVESQSIEWVRPELPVYEAADPTDDRVRQRVRKAVDGSGRRLFSKGLVIQIGSDDPDSGVGGVQLCLQVEARQLQDRGYDVLYLRPFQPLPMLAPSGLREVALVATLNGHRLGAAVRSSQVSGLIQEVQRQARPEAVMVSVHGLLGHSPEILGAQIASVGPSISVFWLHDFFALCSSPSLTMNNLAFCSAPPSDSSLCRLCTHGGQRPKQEERMHHFVSAIKARIVSPSEPAAEILHAHSTLKWPEAEIIAHGRLIPGKSLGVGPVVGKIDSVRIAFVGYPVPHKGAHVFERLRRALAPHPDIELHHFGAVPVDIPGVAFTRVEQGRSNFGTMTRALRESSVDAVLVWPTWPETFSFVAYEAMAAGCQIITHPKSGNVAKAASAHAKAIVFHDESALLNAALTGNLTKQLMRARASELQVSDFEFTGLMAGYLGRENKS